MTETLKQTFADELQQAASQARAGNRQAGWTHLERAHVLSQAYAWPHVYVHWRMLVFAAKHQDWNELVGQVIRLLVAGPGSLLGRAPLGNTGGANVGILTPMKIPDDLAAILATDPKSIGRSRTLPEMVDS